VGIATLVAVTATMLGAVFSSPASAEGRPDAPVPPPTELEVSGPFTATGTLGSECGIFRQVVDGDGVWSGLGASTFELEWCLHDPPDGVNYPVSDGYFTVTSADGTLSGTVTGYIQAGGMPPSQVGFPFRLTLTITDGTDSYESATGSLVLDGAFSYGASYAWGTVAGTVTIPPGMPPSVDSCKQGGWREYVDDAGHGFVNQGGCIAFVLTSA
jgi:hypothetical protein